MPQQQAGHMSAPDRTITSQILLAVQGPSTHAVQGPSTHETLLAGGDALGCTKQHGAFTSDNISRTPSANSATRR
jgi:hypothetical protein